MINPYLGIPQEYFKDKLNGRFIIKKSDLVIIPELMEFINLSTFQNDELNFEYFDRTTKIKIGKLYFKNEKFIRTFQNKIYFDLKPILNYSDNVNLNHIKEELNKLAFYKFDPDTNLYLLDQLHDEQLYPFIEAYFFNKYSNQIIKDVNINVVKTLTDVDLNTNIYNVKTDIKSFIIEMFRNWLLTKEGSLPFINDYYCGIADLIQIKNYGVKKSFLEAEITEFFSNFNTLYNKKLYLISVRIMTIGMELEIKLELKYEDETLRFTINN